MTIATRVKWFLEKNHVPYELIHHPHTHSSAETARAARIPRHCLAKTVLLEDERGYLAVVVPASHRVDLDRLERMLRRRLELASEAELEQLFGDCERGAAPALPTAYGVPLMIDDALLDLNDVYFEAGTHEDVVHVQGDDFLELLDGARHGICSRMADPI